MMEYDNYELLKFSLLKNKDLDNKDENINYLKQTGFFGKGEENENIQKDDFKNNLLSEIKKDKENSGLINKNNYNYNNPYRIMNNNFIIEELKYNSDKKKIMNDKNIKDNKKETLKLKPIIEKSSDKTPIIENKNKRYFLNIDKNNNYINNNNRSKSKNKEKNNRNILPNIDTHLKPSNNISKEFKKKNNNNNNNINSLVKKTEKILNMLNTNKIKKNNETNKQKKQIHKPNISSMTNEQIDVILNKILHKQNVKLVNKIQRNGNNFNNLNNKNINNLNRPQEKKIKLKMIPQNKNINKINIINKGNIKGNAPFGDTEKYIKELKNRLTIKK